MGLRKTPLPEVTKPYCGPERLPQKPDWMAADLVYLGEAAGAWWSPQTTPSLSLPWAGSVSRWRVWSLSSGYSVSPHVVQSLEQPYGGGGGIIPILQMRKLRVRETRTCSKSQFPVAGPGSSPLLFGLALSVCS